MTAGKRGPWTSQLEEARADWQKAHTPATLVSGDKAGWRDQGLLSPSVKRYLKIPKTMLEAWFTSPVRMVLKQTAVSVAQNGKPIMIWTLNLVIKNPQ